MAFPFGQCIGVITGDFIIMTEEPEKKILRVKELAEKYGTVFNTVKAEKIKGEVEVVRKSSGNALP